MHWEVKDKVPPPTKIEDSELPIELMAGLGKISAEGKIEYVRFRTWPIGGISYVKSNNLNLDADEADAAPHELVKRIARELTAAAKHVWTTEGATIEPKFEAQVAWKRHGETRQAPEKSISFKLRTTATSEAPPRAGIAATVQEIASIAGENPMMGLIMLLAITHEREMAARDEQARMAAERERRQEARYDSLIALELGHVDTILGRGQELTDMGIRAWVAAFEDRMERNQSELEKTKAELRTKGFETAVDGFKSVAKDLIGAAFPRAKPAPTPSTPRPRPPAASSSTPSQPSQPDPQPSQTMTMTMTSDPPHEHDEKAKQLIDLGRRLRELEADIAILERYVPSAAASVRALDPDAIHPQDVSAIIEEVLTALRPNDMAGRMQLVKLHGELSEQAVEVIHDLMQLHDANASST